MQPRTRDLCIYRIEKAKEDLKVARLLFEKKHYSQSMNRSYYAIFHITRALLSLDEFDSRKHSGIIAYFNREYIAKGIFDKKYSKIIKGAEKMRNRSDYDDFFVVSKDEAQKQLKNAEDFTEKIEKFIRERLNEIAE